MNLRHIFDARRSKITTPADQLKYLAKQYFEEVNYEDPHETIDGVEIYVGSYDSVNWGFYVEAFDEKEYRNVKNWVTIVEDSWDTLSDEWYQACLEDAKKGIYVESEYEKWNEEIDAENRKNSW